MCTVKRKLNVKEKAFFAEQEVSFFKIENRDNILEHGGPIKFIL
jgi:hypothetical protein